MNYRNRTINLCQAQDYNSNTGKKVMVWRWQADCGAGQNQDKEKAIAAAKHFIDWRIEDPEMNNIF